MTPRTGSNRPLCQGDLARTAGGYLSRGEICAKLSRWTTPFLVQFIPQAYDTTWQQIASQIVEARMLRPKTPPPARRKLRPKTRRQTSGPSVTKPVITSVDPGTAAHPTVSHPGQKG